MPAAAMISCLMALVIAGWAPPALAEDAFDVCPKSGFLRAGTVEVRQVSCPKAKRLIIAFMDESARTGKGHVAVEGFQCRNVAPELRPGIGCTRGYKVARYLGYPPYY